MIFFFCLLSGMLLPPPTTPEQASFQITALSLPAVSVPSQSGRHWKRGLSAHDIDHLFPHIPPLHPLTADARLQKIHEQRDIFYRLLTPAQQEHLTQALQRLNSATQLLTNRDRLLALVIVANGDMAISTLDPESRFKKRLLALTTPAQKIIRRIVRGLHRPFNPTTNLLQPDHLTNVKEGWLMLNFVWDETTQSIPPRIRDQIRRYYDFYFESDAFYQTHGGHLTTSALQELLDDIRFGLDEIESMIRLMPDGYWGKIRPNDYLRMQEHLRIPTHAAA